MYQPPGTSPVRAPAQARRPPEFLGAELRYQNPHVPALRDHGLHSVCLDDALEVAGAVRL